MRNVSIEVTCLAALLETLTGSSWSEHDAADWLLVSFAPFRLHRLEAA